MVEEVKKIRREYQTRSMNIPDFIDTKSNDDYYSYSHYREILNCICSLVRSVKVKDINIDSLIDKSNEHMDSIFFVYENNIEKHILFSDNILNFIDDLLKDLVEKELYEAAINVKKFSEKFYRNE